MLDNGTNLTCALSCVCRMRIQWQLLLTRFELAIERFQSNSHDKFLLKWMRCGIFIRKLCRNVLRIDLNEKAVELVLVNIWTHFMNIFRQAKPFAAAIYLHSIQRTMPTDGKVDSVSFFFSFQMADGNSTVKNSPCENMSTKLLPLILSSIPDPLLLFVFSHLQFQVVLRGVNVDDEWWTLVKKWNNCCVQRELFASHKNGNYILFLLRLRCYPTWRSQSGLK